MMVLQGRGTSTGEGWGLCKQSHRGSGGFYTGQESGSPMRAPLKEREVPMRVQQGKGSPPRE